jgi:hypothetical protein
MFCQIINEIRIKSLQNEIGINKEIVKEKEVCLKWQILGIDDEMANYIEHLCNKENVDVNLVLGILIRENPTFNPQITNKNKNGTIDCGLFQLNSKYIRSDFEWRYWSGNIEFDPFNYMHNSYIAIHHIKRLSEICKNQNEVIMSYNCGRNKVVNNKIPKSTVKYLYDVNKNIAMLNSIDNDITHMYGYIK